MTECLFCNLSQNNPKIHFEDEHAFIVDDINPHAPIHQLIIPKRHIVNLNALTEGEWDLIGHLMMLAQKQAVHHHIANTGFRTVFNCNAAAGQTIYHLHLHLLGGREFSWPPG